MTLKQLFVVSWSRELELKRFVLGVYVKLVRYITKIEDIQTTELKILFYQMLKIRSMIV